VPSIDFGKVKELVSFRQVLDLLRWRHVRREAGWYRGPCPVHRSSRASSDCFSVREGGWKCHSCGRHGDQLRLWAEATGQDLYPATLDLCRRLGLEVQWKGKAGQRFPQ
jgi:DNA primase